MKIQDSTYCETEIQILINGFHANIVYSNMLKMKHDMINFIQWQYKAVFLLTASFLPATAKYTLNAENKKICSQFENWLNSA